MVSNARMNETGARFGAKANRDRLTHELDGIVRGVALDGLITPGEAKALSRWCQTVRTTCNVRELHDFADLLDSILADGVITEDERLDMEWGLRSWTTPNIYYDAVTSDVQRLHGLLMGLLADGELSDAEVRRLQDWLEDHPHLQGAWPFDEIQSVITHVLHDGAIDASERALLRAFFADLLPAPDHEVVTIEGVDTSQMTLRGICSVDPTIIFHGRSFAFSGTAKAGRRSELAARVTAAGAKVVNHISANLDFLVVGQDGNENWAFSCYGRKIEQAINLRRREGARILIVHERDLMDALQDVQA